MLKVVYKVFQNSGRLAKETRSGMKGIRFVLELKEVGQYFFLSTVTFSDVFGDFAISLFRVYRLAWYFLLNLVDLTVTGSRMLLAFLYLE